MPQEVGGQGDINEVRAIALVQDHRCQTSLTLEFTAASLTKQTPVFIGTCAVCSISSREGPERQNTVSVRVYACASVFQEGCSAKVLRAPVTKTGR